MADLTFADAFDADFFAPGLLAAVRTPTIAASPDTRSAAVASWP